MLKIKEQYYNIETLSNYGFKKEFESYKIRDNGIPLFDTNDDYWCYDGERGDKKTVEIQVLKQEIKVIGKAQK